MALSYQTRWAVAVGASVAAHAAILLVALAGSESVRGPREPRGRPVEVVFELAGERGRAGVATSSHPAAGARREAAERARPARGDEERIQARGVASQPSLPAPALASDAASRAADLPLPRVEEAPELAVASDAAPSAPAAAPQGPAPRMDAPRVAAGGDAASQGALPGGPGGRGGAADRAGRSGGGSGNARAAPSCWTDVSSELASRARRARAVRERGLTGEVVVVFRLQAGAVSDERVEKSSGNPLLDELTLQLVRGSFDTDCAGEGRWPVRWR